MREIRPGILHWTVLHPRIGFEVSSYLLAEERVLIDPMVPAEGLGAFDAAPPVAILLTNRHHYRGAARFEERFGCTVHCNRLGIHEFRNGERIVEFGIGDTLPGGVVALRVGGICPDETALHIPHHRAVALADGAVRMTPDGPLGFVPDVLMDDPPKTKARLAEAYREIAALPIETLLLAHGMPLLEGGGEALRALADGVLLHGSGEGA